METLKQFMLLGLAMLLDTAAAVMFKHGTNQLLPASRGGWRGHVDNIVAALKRKEVTFGVLTYIIEYIVWLAFISTTALNVAYPLSSINIVLILVASSIFLSEKVGRRRWLGAALVMAGIVLVGGEA